MTDRNPNIDYSEEDMEYAVDKGVALLDEKFPTWYEAINLEQLEIREFDLCVIGQTFWRENEMSYAEGLVELGLNLGQDPVDYGFDLGVDATDGQWDRLQERWTTIVRNRVEDWATRND